MPSLTRSMTRPGKMARRIGSSRRVLTFVMLPERRRVIDPS
jgi:hypothetical protein